MAEDYRPYIIRRGDHLQALAFERGATVDEVWNHASNDKLRALRASPDVLSPGDVIYLPISKLSGASLRKQSTNQYQATVPLQRLELELRFTGCELAPETPGCTVDPASGARVTKEEVGESASPSQKIVRVTLECPITTKTILLDVVNFERKYQLVVGDVDPSTTVAGVAKRLENLGYLTSGGPIEEADVPRAVKAFQRAAGLPEGELDQATRDALVDASGQPD
ncbi:MAG: peptidoglycan-binding domain-containing protein [Polyangiaceae bacterium]